MATRIEVRFYLALISALLIPALAVWAANKYVPPHHLPWKPLDLNAPLGLATKTQLMKVSLGPRKTCMNLMDEQAQGAAYTVLPETKTKSGCGWSVALEATRLSDIKFNPAQMNALCPQQAASYIWLRQVDAKAQALFGTGIKQVHHYGTYSCRKVAGSDRWSEHAFANAWDVSGFELENGEIISVLKDWKERGPKGQFLRAAHKSGCNVFRVSLGPSYNAAHKDHFHLDMGPGTLCR